MAPFDLGTLGALSSALVFAAVGFGFGAVLELGGFGDTRKLAGQFYLRDFTVLKTMFTGIVVAAVLVFLSSALGLLDLSRVWVNPTYLSSEILGGLIMGVGFVVGGFCPGTSLVAAATLKVDGLLFVLGGLTGVWLFGESVASFEPWWLSSYHGRLTLPDWLGLSTGATVLLVVAFALLAFWGVEALERKLAAQLETAAPTPRRRAWRLVGAAALVLAAVAVAAKGQPSPEQLFRKSAPLVALEQGRGMLVHPAEVVALKRDVAVEVDLLDLRSEHDFNLFHLGGARRVDPAALERPEELKALLDQPATAVTFLVGNGDAEASRAWRRLSGLGVKNLYVVEGGVNRWLELYPPPACVGGPVAPAGAPGTDGAADALRWRLAYATGASLPSAWPELPTSRDFRLPCGGDGPRDRPAHEATWPTYAFQKRVKLQAKGAVKGGCG